MCRFFPCSEKMCFRYPSNHSSGGASPATSSRWRRSQSRNFFSSPDTYSSLSGIVDASRCSPIDPEGALLRISAVSPTVGNHRRHSVPPMRLLSCKGRGKKEEGRRTKQNIVPSSLFLLPFSLCPGSTTEYSHVFVSDWNPVLSITRRVQRSGEAVSGAARSHRRHIRARRQRMDSRTALDSRASTVRAARVDRRTRPVPFG